MTNRSGAALDPPLSRCGLPCTDVCLSRVMPNGGHRLRDPKSRCGTHSAGPREVNRAQGRAFRLTQGADGAPARRHSCSSRAPGEPPPFPPGQTARTVDAGALARPSATQDSATCLTGNSSSLHGSRAHRSPPDYYRDAQGRRRRLFAATREQAEDLLAEKIRESRQAAPPVEDPEITPQDYVATSLASNTHRGYAKTLDRHILPAFGGLKLRALHRRHI